MESRFQDYIDYVCSGIRSKRTRAEISDELLSHLAERYEQNRAVGQAEVDAQALAAEQMDDREKLRQKFAALYRFYTPDYLRTALNCLLFGLFFIFTRLNLFPFSDRILPLYLEHRNHGERAEERVPHRVFYSGFHSTVDILQYDCTFDCRPEFYGIKGKWRFVEEDSTQ